MKKTLHVLVIGHSEEEAALLGQEVGRGGYDILLERVYSSATMLEALSRHSWDLVLSEWKLPRFSALAALELLRKNAPATPLIVVSEERDEEAVVAAIKAGAHNFIVKQHLERLLPAVEAALAEKKKPAAETADGSPLKHFDERLKLALEVNNSGLWDWNVETGEIHFSSQWEAMLGFREGEFTPTLHAWQALLHPEDKTAVNRALNEHLEGRTPYYETEHRLKSQKGEWIWVQNRGRVVERDKQGRALRVIGTYTDISSRKRAEASLRLKTAEFETIFNAIPEAVIFSNTRREIVLVNPACCVLFQYTPDELQGKSEEIFYANAADFQNAINFPRGANGKEPLAAWEILFKKKTGQEFTGERIETPLQDAQGKSIGFLAVIRDISARAKTTGTSNGQETNYRRLFEEDLTGNYIISPQGAIITCNPSFARIFGFASVDEARKSNFFDLHPDPQFKASFLELLSKEKKLESQELELQRRDGKTVYVVQNVIGEFGENGDLQMIRGYVFDDTRRREMESQVVQSQKMESLGTLAGSIAHDFNNLLSVISANSEILLMKMNSEDPLRKAAEQIKQTSRQAAILTHQILTFSRKQVVQPRVIDLNEVVENVAKILHRLIGKDIEMHTILNPDLGKVKIDPVQIEQIIINLAVNARDAMPGGGKLTIGTNNVTVDKEMAAKHIDAQAGLYVLLAVSDTGTGMDAETIKHIFEPFFTTKKKGKGTGLGLSTVYGIVKQNKGFIDVYSEPGKGSIFKIYLPRQGEGQ